MNSAIFRRSVFRRSGKPAAFVSRTTRNTKRKNTGGVLPPDEPISNDYCIRADSTWDEDYVVVQGYSQDWDIVNQTKMFCEVQRKLRKESNECNDPTVFILGTGAMCDNRIVMRFQHSGETLRLM